MPPWTVKGLPKASSQRALVAEVLTLSFVSGLERSFTESS